MGGVVRSEKDGALGWLIFDHPERRNAISVEMWRQIPAAVNDLAKAPGSVSLPQSPTAIRPSFGLAPCTQRMLAEGVTADDLSAHTLLAVRESDPRLGLTEAGERQSAVYLSDFHAKKAAILKGLGFGWLPDWLVGAELKKGVLVPLKLAGGSTHVFEPRLYARADAQGRAARRLLELLAAG